LTQFQKARSYTSNVTVILDDIPALWLCLGQLCSGVAALWLSLQKAPLRGRNGEAWPIQRFGKVSLRVVGTAMVLLSLWDFSIADKPSFPVTRPISHKTGNSA
jgi:hypothetical protein